MSKLGEKPMRAGLASNPGQILVPYCSGKQPIHQIYSNLDLTVRVSYGTMLAVSEALTRRQRGVLDAAASLTRRAGHGPSVRDIARELGVTAATVQEHIVELERKGFVRRSGTAFGLELIDQGRRRASPATDEVVDVPIVGQIAAGSPLEALESGNECISLPRGLLRGESFVLRVRGESMRDDAILDGDLVVIQKKQTAENGEIVVALLEDGSATLKRLYREGSRFRLQPANDSMAPIVVDHVEVQGVVTGVIRRFASE